MQRVILACEHTQWHNHSRQDSSGREIGPSQRPVPDNTQYSQETNIHASGGIRTRDPSRRPAADPCLRPLGHWDRLQLILILQNTHESHFLQNSWITSESCLRFEFFTVVTVDILMTSRSLEHWPVCLSSQGYVTKQVYLHCCAGGKEIIIYCVCVDIMYLTDCFSKSRF